MGVVLLAVALMFYAAESEVPWLFLLALWLLALVPAAFGYAGWNRRGTSVRLAVRESRPGPASPVEELPDAVLRRSPYAATVFEGDEFALEIEFRAKGGRRGPVWAWGDLSGQRFGAGTGVVTREGWSRVRWTRDARRGVIGMSNWHFGTSDPLGLFRGIRALPDGEVGLVLPTFKSLAERREAREAEASVAAPRAGYGNEPFGVREYRPGDSLRRIHWRSSARHGELVVREYEPPGVQTLTMLVDPRPPSSEIADQIARIAASEAWDCLRAGGRVVLGGGLETRDIWDVLEWLARYRVGFEGIVAQPDVVVAANPDLLEPNARRNWLVGDAPVENGVAHERVGTAWPI